jgi:murein DD-endopeptidase MepM/ murein hydrolase activator NlpD
MTYKRFLMFILLLIMTSLSLERSGLALAQDESAPPPEGVPITEEQPLPSATEAPIFLQIITPTNPPPPFETFSEGGLTLEVLFDRLPQGRVGVLRLRGTDIFSARVAFLQQDVSFFYDEADQAYYAIISSGIDQTASRDYEITVTVTRTGGEIVTFTTTTRVVLGGFIRQDVMLPPDRTFLIDPVMERTEFSRLNSLFSVFTEGKLWDEAGFILPVQAELTSPFGAFRVFNGTTEARHTGWDFRVPVGTPIRTIASGRVAFSGLLDIRGNYIVIDHGQGIYSAYAHFSQSHVTRGQQVESGQIIGVSGNTGRSSGPHLHWEMAVNGEWVDSMDFLNTWLPIRPKPETSG